MANSAAGVGASGVARVSSTGTLVHEMPMGKSREDMSEHTPNGEDRGYAPRASVAPNYLSVSTTLSVHSRSAEPSAALQRARAAKHAGSKTLSTRTRTLLRQTSFGRVAVRELPRIKERSITAETAALEAVDRVSISLPTDEALVRSASMVRLGARTAVAMQQASPKRDALHDFGEDDPGAHCDAAETAAWLEVVPPSRPITRPLAARQETPLAGPNAGPEASGAVLDLVGAPAPNALTANPFLLLPRTRASRVHLRPASHSSPEVVLSDLSNGASVCRASGDAPSSGNAPTPAADDVGNPFLRLPRVRSLRADGGPVTDLPAILPGEDQFHRDRPV